jgi:sulfur relay (sulfurtransferase) DsrF/TusC family protein
MNNKKISVLIRKSPYHEFKAIEAMRMSVGLTLRDIKVFLVFIEDGLDALLEDSLERAEDADIRKHLEMFIELGQTLVVERESMEASGNLSVTFDPVIWDRDAILLFPTQCDGVVIV